MAIHIEYETDLSLEIPVEDIICNVIDTALDMYDCPYEAEVNVIITDNNSIAAINEEYRNIAKPTDVLSFPMIDYETAGDFSIIDQLPEEECFDPDSGELLLGDIILSVEKIIEQAESYGHSKERELGFLTAHSMLHLFGFDHMEDDEKAEMRAKEESVMEQINVTR